MTNKNPLEEFILKCADSIGGIWEEVEPQVYELMLPEESRGDFDCSSETLLITFDPEAVFDYPQAELLLFGHPLLEKFFEQAQSRGERTRLYLSGSNLSPHNLTSVVSRSLQIPEGVELEISDGRIYHFASALFWFQGTFTSDEKEQAIFPVGVDLHWGRISRHLEEILKKGSLSSTRFYPYPDAPRISLEKAYSLARQEVLSPLSIGSHNRLAALQTHLHQQTERISRYFADLRTELEERKEKWTAKGKDTSSFKSQRESLFREEQTRITELRQKMSLKVQVRLLNLALLFQPKLSLSISFLVEEKKKREKKGEIKMVWDPERNLLEAANCPLCAQPTLAFALTQTGQIVCPACAERSPKKTQFKKKR